MLVALVFSLVLNLLGPLGIQLESEKTRGHPDTFRELVDEILNAGLLAIPIVLLARFVTVGIPINIMRHFRSFTPRAIQILTWGGLAVNVIEC